MTVLPLVRGVIVGPQVYFPCAWQSVIVWCLPVRRCIRCQTIPASILSVFLSLPCGRSPVAYAYRLIRCSYLACFPIGIAQNPARGPE